MTRLFYHATDAVFDRFDPALQGSKGATNGHLGVWVGNEKSECEMFGDVLMTLSLDGDVVAYPMAYEEIRRLHHNSMEMEDGEAAIFWKSVAADLMEDGYNVIDIHEPQGVLHSILMDLDGIVVESHEFNERPKSFSWGRR